MRGGHNYSSSSEEGFESTVRARSPLVPVEQRQLVDEDRSQGEACGVESSLGGYRPVRLEEGLEVLVEVLYGHVTQPVQDAPDLHARVGVRIGSPPPAGHQEHLPCQASPAHVLGVVVRVPQHETRFVGQLLDQKRGDAAVGGIGRGEPRGQRYPHPGHRARQVKLPAVDPPVPARLGPPGFSVDGRVGHDARFPVLLVPHPAAGPQDGGVYYGHRSPASGPRLDQRHQVATQQADPLRQGIRQGAQPPLEGAPRREAPVLAEHFAQGAHLFGGLFEHRKELAHLVEAPYDHDHKRLEEEVVRVEARPAPPRRGARRCRRDREAVDQAHQLDKDGLLGDHGWASEGRVLGHTPCSGAFGSRSSRLPAPSDIYDQPSVSRVNSESRGVASHRLPRPPGWSPNHPRRATRWTYVPTAPCVPGGSQLYVSSSSTPVWTTSGLSAESRVTSLWRSTASSGSIPTTQSKEAHTVAPPL